MSILKSLTQRRRRNHLESVGAGLSYPEEFSLSKTSKIRNCKIRRGALMPIFAGSVYLESSFKRTSSDGKGYWADGTNCLVIC